MPEFTLPPIEGGPGKGFSSAELKAGKVTVLNVFASWCGPCRTEHPFITRLAEMKVAKVYGRLHARNHASIFNYKAQGFTCEAILRRHEVGPDGERRDMLMFGLLREEWLEARTKRAAS